MYTNVRGRSASIINNYKIIMNVSKTQKSIKIPVMPRNNDIFAFFFLEIQIYMFKLLFIYL